MKDTARRAMASRLDMRTYSCSFLSQFAFARTSVIEKTGKSSSTAISVSFSIEIDGQVLSARFTM